MIGTIARVVRGEGFPSALRRAAERASEAVDALSLRIAAAGSGVASAEVLNVIGAAAPRLGGVQAQLAARLRCERELRSVALFTPGTLELSVPRRHARRVSRDLESGIREAIALTGAKALHFEGTAGVPLRLLSPLTGSGVRLILSVHDFSFFCARPNLMEEPSGEFCRFSTDVARCHRCLRHTWDVDEGEQARRRGAAREILSAASAVVFPSRFILERHRELFDLPQLGGIVIAPAGGPSLPAASNKVQKRAIAFAGSVKRHKGGHLLPEIARLAGDIELHVFGGGDEELLRELRRNPRVKVHGYYRTGELTTLLESHGVGLVLLPSIVPESFGLTLSESWQAGAAAVAFDLGAQAERIREQGGGWLAPLESGAAGLAAIVARWQAGEISTPVPSSLPRPEEAAHACVELYRSLGLR